MRQKPTLASQTDRMTAPNPGAIPSFQVPSVTAFDAKPGVAAYLVERPQLPIVALALTFELGSLRDPLGKEGLVSLTWELIASGTDRHPFSEWTRQVANLGSSVSVFASREEGGIGLRCLRWHYDATLELVREALLNPRLSLMDFHRLRAQKLASLLQARKQPTSVAARVFPALLFGSAHGYGRSPTRESYEALTISDCQEMYQRIRNLPVRIFAFGQISSHDIVHSTAQFYLAMHEGMPWNLDNIPPPMPLRGTLFGIHLPSAVQTVVHVGGPGPLRTDPNLEARNMVANILGGSFSSRINLNLRESLGATYGARAGFTYLRQAGYFSVFTQVTPSATGTVLREIHKEIDDLKKFGPTQDEVTREKAGAIQRFPAAFATGEQILATHAGLVRFGLPLNFYQDFPHRMLQVSKDDVWNAARHELPSQDYKVLVVGNIANLRQDLVNLARDGIFGNEGYVELNPEGHPI